MNRYQRQQGHAAILFALMIPLLFGVFILGTDGARALQDKARLEEASEVAALAIAGQSGGSEQARNKLATDYIQYYFPNAKVDDLKTAVIACENNISCQPNGSASERFFEYQVAAHIQEPNWFSKASIETSFGDNLNVGGYSSARKYQSKTVDVVLVADFSSSMGYPVTPNRSPKYIELQNVISDVANTIDSYNDKVTEDKPKNTLGFVGFNIYTYPLDGFQQGYNYLICKNDTWLDPKVYKNPSNETSYRYIKDGWCGELYNKNGRRINNTNDIDYSETVNQVFNSDLFKPALQAINNNMLSNGQLKFHDIPLTSNVISVSNTVDSFYPSGGTAFYSGLIKGAQMAYTGHNPRRLIILLSDGLNTVDNEQAGGGGNNTATDRLIDAGLCTNIIQQLSDQKTADNQQVNARMFAIGFGYELSENPHMAECVGDNNVYDAKDSEAIKNKILELIAEEMGRLSPSNEQ